MNKECAVTYVYECLVAIPAGGYSAQPTTMRFEAQNYLQARSYFSSFGKLLQDPRIVATKG
jgi:hypothetical protein